MCSLCNHAAGLILSCKVLYPFSGLQRSGVVVLRLRPEQRARSSAKPFSRRVFAFGDTEGPYVHWRQPCHIKSNSDTVAWYRKMQGIGAVVHRIPQSDCTCSVLRANATLRAAMYLYSLSSDRYLAVPSSLRLRVSAVRHMMLSYSNRRK